MWQQATAAAAAAAAAEAAALDGTGSRAGVYSATDAHRRERRDRANTQPSGSVRKSLLATLYAL